jgi:peptidoglycan/xylan/chitin deacetylase (PgdA/CDA1 family)
MLSRRALGAAALATLAGPAAASCRRTVHLTIDTGWMDTAERIAAVMARHGVKATLFLADERTFRGDTSLSDAWAPFWRARAAEGHAFGSHTLRHWYFRGDAGERVRYVPHPSSGGGAREGELLDRAGLCAELRAPEERLRAMTGRGFDPIWRAPGGRTTPNALAFAEACGFRHVGWTANGFLGDELPSDRYPNDALLRRALATIRDGEVLVMHWGIRSRQQKYADVFEPLIVGLKERGFCFATLTAPPPLLLAEARR